MRNQERKGISLYPRRTGPPKSMLMVISYISLASPNRLLNKIRNGKPLFKNLLLSLFLSLSHLGKELTRISKPSLAAASPAFGSSWALVSVYQLFALPAMC